MTDTDQLTRARELLLSANKWVRLVEERAPPAWLRHDADPTPLRKTIDAFLRETDAKS